MPDLRLPRAALRQAPPIRALVLLLVLLAAAGLFSNCGGEGSGRHQPAPLFDLLPAERTGIGFTNSVTDTDTLNILDYLYYYNGGGVAIADFDRDSLPDVFFVSNQGSCILYHNKGDLHFEDITAKAGVSGKGNWKTGVTVTDINGDGWPDIYLSEVGNYKSFHGRNELFVNNGPAGRDATGAPTFTERAHEYGLDIEGFNTQAVFFDYDHDGDLDCFIVNHSVHSNESYGDTSIRRVKNPYSGDKLLRNDSVAPGPTATIHGAAAPGPAAAAGRHFTEITEQAGIYSSLVGYGLNVMVGDMNNDGWEDIYVSNDFHENDYYYLNKHDGTFAEVNRQALGHESRFSMGSDIADINNDGWPDLITLDMLPPQENLLKTASGDDMLSIYQYKLRYGYHHQYSRNCLQLNRGVPPAAANPAAARPATAAPNATQRTAAQPAATAAARPNDPAFPAPVNRFSDIALYAGVAATDWSWSPLIADFDNDGRKDIFITNGIQRRPNDLDLIKFMSSGTVASALQKGRAADLETVQKMPPGKTTNYIFQGTDSLVFSDRTRDWGFDHPAFSNGSAYADLDNDGDLDLVVNTVNGPAMIYRNNSTGAHYLDVALNGPPGNPLGIGAKIIVKNKGVLQLSYLTPTHGFESSSLQYLHFGLGSQAAVDTVQIIWTDGKTQLLTRVPADRRLTLDYHNAIRGQPLLLPSSAPAAPSNAPPLSPAATPAVAPAPPPPSPVAPALLTNITDSISFPYQRAPLTYNDFDVQPLMPHQLSTRGPRMAVADIDGDGLDDVFICGSDRQPGSLFHQLPSGKFEPVNQQLFAADAFCEDADAVFFDANGDGYTDLLVVSGGNRYAEGSANLTDRLYLNDGKGNFRKGAALPLMPGNKSVIVAADLDKDGHTDLFIGGSAVFGHYGETPQSWLLLGDGKGNFISADESKAPGLAHIGMVTGAVATDVDKDGWPDLVLVGEWMPITLFKNHQGRLINETNAAGLQHTKGWWTTIRAADINGDGREDLLVGNWGTNSKLHASEKAPLRLYCGDFDHNGQSDQLLAMANADGNYYPFLGKDDLDRHMPSIIRKKYNTYSGFAGQTIGQAFGPHLTGATLLEAECLSSVLLTNNGHGRFDITPLPKETQWSPVFTFLVGDLDRDGAADIISAGNFYGVTPYEGRYDAGYGTVLLGGAPPPSLFHSVPIARSGLLLDGEIRDSKIIHTARGPLYIFSRNDNSLLFYRPG